ncbi:MAG: IclR family transcriptional regulator C-terminal domain-containing protein, partial [Actinomycetota bacterium]|nr:IclR family transcriptional regulator C-terminal domain-containing protein [Actinomycetota bacterium]
RPLDRYTPNSMVDPDQIRERLEEIRSDGFVWVLEEFSEGINSVAAPLFNGTGAVVGALHSHGPSYRFPQEPLGGIIAGRISAAAVAVSEALGYLA